jgi:hypothetical protein
MTLQAIDFNHKYTTLSTGGTVMQVEYARPSHIFRIVHQNLTRGICLIHLALEAALRSFLDHVAALEDIDHANIFADVVEQPALQLGSDEEALRGVVL